MEPIKSNKRRKKYLIPNKQRRVIIIVFGLLVGLACRFLPPAWQGPCGVVAKIVGLFGGGA